MISSALMNLATVAEKYNIAIVIVNMMKTGRKEAYEYNRDQGQSHHESSKPEPIFGEDLFMCVTNRVFLERE